MLKAIDFFCGGGGMTCGLRQAGINVIAGVDIDKDCALTYEYNNPGSSFIEADIRNLNIDFFEREMKVQRNDRELIMIGCSPCQYYSIINTKRDKSEKTKDLLLDFQRFVEYYNPGYVLVENVPGIVTNKQSVLPGFIEFLECAGYKHIKNRIVDMSYYGVPQTRRRFSLIASRVSQVSFPQREEKQALLKDFIGEKNGFPKLKAGAKDYTDFCNSVAGLSLINLKRLESTPKNGGSRLAWKNNPELQLKCFEDKDKNFIDTYGRMSWERPASTITTKFTSISNGRFGHPEEDRALSLREGATLQTFPPDYVFKTKKFAAKARIIGNAVPPEFAKRLGKSIILSGLQ